MAKHRFDVASTRPAPWKNGAGSTREIACWPPGAGFEAFDWRVSIASIASSGPFSAFAGVDRIITLLDGDGVRLQGPGIDHPLDTALQPFAFSGDLPVNCTLLGGESSDFNVMSRRDRVRADLRVLRSATELAAAPAGLLLAVHGQWQADDEALASRQGLWWSGKDHPWSLRCTEDDAALLAVAWHPVQAEAAS